MWVLFFSILFFDQVLKVYIKTTYTNPEWSFFSVNNTDVQKYPIVSKIDDKKDGVLITGLPFNTDYSDSSLNNLISDMQSWKKTRMIGSAAMASCYIASGKAELYKEKGIYLWDILAGAAIVEAAGGLAEIKNVRENYQVDVTFSNQKIK